MSTGMDRMTAFITENLNGYNLPAHTISELKGILLKRFGSRFSEGLSPEGRMAMEQAARREIESAKSTASRARMGQASAKSTASRARMGQDSAKSTASRAKMGQDSAKSTASRSKKATDNVDKNRTMNSNESLLIDSDESWSKEYNVNDDFVEHDKSAEGVYYDSEFVKQKQDTLTTNRRRAKTEADMASMEIQHEALLKDKVSDHDGDSDTETVLKTIKNQPGEVLNDITDKQLNRLDVNNEIDAVQHMSEMGLDT